MQEKINIEILKIKKLVNYYLGLLLREHPNFNPIKSKKIISKLLLKRLLK
jgi:hypothetical protein